jgi:hypothetical protein
VGCRAAERRLWGISSNGFFPSWRSVLIPRVSMTITYLTMIDNSWINPFTGSEDLQELTALTKSSIFSRNGKALTT